MVRIRPVTPFGPTGTPPISYFVPYREGRRYLLDSAVELSVSAAARLWDWWVRWLTVGSGEHSG
jgi:hypothetical protein